ncbi:hypothetical protein AX14_003351 [Amanita brunnescens Koide BX004]|nr:hypothetical protein AX14_003351 [Amanita brunnescens Koide BX004]
MDPVPFFLKRLTSIIAGVNTVSAKPPSTHPMTILHLLSNDKKWWACPWVLLVPIIPLVDEDTEVDKDWDVVKGPEVDKGSEADNDVAVDVKVKVTVNVDEISPCVVFGVNGVPNN